MPQIHSGSFTGPLQATAEVNKVFISWDGGNLHVDGERNEGGEKTRCQEVV